MHLLLRTLTKVVYAFLFTSAFAAFSADDAPALPVFDFANSGRLGAMGWTAAHDLAPFERTPDGLRLKITGNDPYIEGPELKLPAQTGLFVRLRMRSESGGLGQLFYFEKSAGAENFLFEVPAEQWTEIVLPLPPLGPKYRFRLDPPGEKGNCDLAFVRIERTGEYGVTSVAASVEMLTLFVRSGPVALEIVALSPHRSVRELAQAPVVAEVPALASNTVTLPRFDGGRDRLYDGFAAREKLNPSAGAGCVRYVNRMQRVSKSNAPWKDAASKKGLQVQMVDDALALGIKHAALNVSMAALVDWEKKPDSLLWKMDGADYYFNRKTIESMQVKKLSDAGVQVNLILLNYCSTDPRARAVTVPARVVKEPRNHLAGFNVDSEDGLRYFKASIEFVADRFSGDDTGFGRVAGYIVGNEVDSHSDWYDLGPAPMTVLADEYMRALRVVHTAVRKSSANARVYISLEHCWSVSNCGDPLGCCAGKTFIDYLNRLGKMGGDFNWHVAYHPYPEDLFEPRVWLDKNASHSLDTKYITFKNLEQLPEYLARDEMRCDGKPRHIILSEQGFHTPDDADGANGEDIQAAAYCYAWYRVSKLDSIDAFILHRHVDHAQEGGLRLGLWSRQPDSVATAGRKKHIYEVFHLADTPDWEKAFEFALPVIGIQRWEDILNKP